MTGRQGCWVIFVVVQMRPDLTPFIHPETDPSDGPVSLLSIVTVCRQLLHSKAKLDLFALARCAASLRGRRAHVPCGCGQLPSAHHRQHTLKPQLKPRASHGLWRVHLTRRYFYRYFYRLFFLRRWPHPFPATSLLRSLGVTVPALVLQVWFHPFLHPCSRLEKPVITSNISRHSPVHHKQW